MLNKYFSVEQVQKDFETLITYKLSIVNFDYEKDYIFQFKKHADKVFADLKDKVKNALINDWEAAKTTNKSAARITGD